ncbi:hypothetical protein BFJ65_g16181 [Fusarium oxysporum f. sp. cepae]|uniref:F-box domain-containing protein n=1 Tax=Fusarium oxysporum f. sp. cepae TaxID=396571 RepID=A0A3L6MXM5_FUSOX|nr:hypothetical protein BFJ65_g16181 [Fusarium oxysporum f. sp. cepae]RKK35107.1 hypothetical protein BFJ67_g13464 [Fusarium oxysporum f. sp. cepae]
MPITVHSHRADPRKAPTAKSLVTLANTLCTISEQKGTDRDAQRRALAALSICQKFGFARFSEAFPEEREINRRVRKCLTDSQTDMVSRLPTEIYAMIIRCLVNDTRGKSPEEMKVRAHTLRSLTSTCRVFQILCEEHLYTNIQCKRLSIEIKPQWLLCFALAVEPRRAHTIRSMKCDFRPHYYQYQAWLETLRLCTSLTHLRLAWRGMLPQNFLEQMGNLVAACPKVTEFEFHLCRHEDPGPIETEQKSRKFALQFADFALQLRHLEVVGLFEYPIEILNFDLPNLKSFTLDIWGYRDDFFQNLSDRTPCLETLNIFGAEQIWVHDLEAGCKTWGKVLRSLYINDFRVWNLRSGILSHLLPHLKALEELSLGPQSRFPLSDIQAIAQTDAPRLKAFRWLVDDAVFEHDPLANSEKINKAIVDIFNAHSATLNIFIIDEEFDFWNFGMDIFKHLHKAKNLESLRVQLHDIPTKEEIEGLLTACPKLGQSETGLMVVKEFLTECSLATMEYKEDSLEAVESSWGSVHHPKGMVRSI